MQSAKTNPVVTIVPQARRAVSSATDYAWTILKPDGHWNGELLSNVTMTAEQVFFYQSLTLEKREIPDADAYRRYLLAEQQADGSWSIAPDHPGDVSTSSEAYLALKILGLPQDAPEMQRASNFIQRCGGVAKVRVFTRIFFAQFGLFPWAAVPELPAEFIFMPSWVPMNLYRFSSWARSTIIPLFLITHHRPVYPLPNGTSRDNSFVDELWVDARNKMAPLGPSLLGPWGTDWLSYFFAAANRILGWLNGLRNNPLRSYARRRCVEWILERQEPAGDWAGIIPPMHAGVQALLLEGFPLHSDTIRLAIEAIERFTWQDERGKRLQSCVSPVWDTVLMTRGLCEAGVDRNDPRLRKSARWIKQRQILGGREGDWRVYNPHARPGGFSFEYHNTWYPDVDDTAAAILALVTQDLVAVDSTTVTSAALWICSMQNGDGGWAAFDLGNDKLWLNRIPFSDMDALCDPSTADVTGRIVEAFGLMIRTARKEHLAAPVLDRITSACDRGIAYLVRAQEASGAWYGRWGCNYVYGTSNVLCGLAYFAAADNDDDDDVSRVVDDGIAWLKSVQNVDGGWGEDLLSYRDPSRVGKGPSTASQTAWALMALLTTCSPADDAVLSGVAHLLHTQTDVRGGAGAAASWPERLYTGTGFPNFFYIGYTLYRHYFPLMALGRFIRAVEDGKKGEGE